MRRICGGSAFRLAARFAQPAGVSVLSMAMLLGTPGLALADPVSPDGTAALIADIADANQRLQDLAAEIQTEQESVNKALVDVQSARDNAAGAQRDVEIGRQAVADADTAITAAQRRFDRFAAAIYVSGPSDSYLTVTDPSEIIATATAGEMLTAGSERALANLQRARTEQVNKESADRLAKKNADRAVSDDQSSQDTAASALTDTQRKFGEQQQQIKRLAAQRNEAQAKLVAARRQLQPGSGDRWEPRAGSPAPDEAGLLDGLWDPTLPAVPSAFVDGDPLAVINTVLGIGKTSAQATANMGRKFLQSVGLLKPDAPPTADSGITNGRIPHVYGRQASNT
jgi:predicted  nucleic acid-binding Zn-ribbon protein